MRIKLNSKKSENMGSNEMCIKPYFQWMCLTIRNNNICGLAWESEHFPRLRIWVGQSPKGYPLPISIKGSYFKGNYYIRSFNGGDIKMI